MHLRGLSLRARNELLSRGGKNTVRNVCNGTPFILKQEEPSLWPCGTVCHSWQWCGHRVFASTWHCA